MKNLLPLLLLCFIFSFAQAQTTIRHNGVSELKDKSSFYSQINKSLVDFESSKYPDFGKLQDNISPSHKSSKTSNRNNQQKINKLISTSLKKNNSINKLLKDYLHNRNFQEQANIKKTGSLLKNGIVQYNYGNQFKGTFASINQNSLSSNTAKLDSMVIYESETFPVFDSTLISNQRNTLNEDSLVIERITTAYDSVGGEQKIKYIFDYDSQGNKILDIKYNWDTLNNEWLNADKAEFAFNELGLRTLSVYYSVNENNFVPERKNERSYDQSGNTLSFIHSKWDTIVADWIAITKTESEYNTNNRRTQRIEYRAIADIGLTPRVKYTYEYQSSGDVITSTYSWNINEMRFDWESDKGTFHLIEYDENSNVKLEKYIDYETPGSEWRKEYYYNESGQLVHATYKEYPGPYEWRKEYYYNERGQVVHSTYKEYPGPYEWWQHFEYDDYGNMVLYEREEYDSIVNEMVLKQFDFYDYNEYGLLILEAHERRNDSIGEKELLQEKEYVYSEQNELLQVIEQYEKDGERHYRSISNYKYSSNREYTVEKYAIRQTGTKTIEEEEGVLVLEYDPIINKCIRIIGKESGSGDTEELQTITYDENWNKTAAIVFNVYKYEYNYDYLGRDSLTIFSEKKNENWIVDHYKTYEYNQINIDSLVIIENYYSLDSIYPEYASQYYYKNELLRTYTFKSKKESNWYGNDSLSFNYDEKNRVKQIYYEGNSNSGFIRKTNYNLISDTLYANEYRLNPTNNQWESEGYEYYIIDTLYANGSVVGMPDEILLGDAERTGILLCNAPSEYGQVLEYEVSGSFDYHFSDHEKFYYSETTPLIGNGVINGYLFQDNFNQQKGISISTLKSGNPFPNATIKLISKNDDFVLASMTSDSDGYFKFRGIPMGNYYLKVEIPGHEQKSTYDIKISVVQQRFINQNFIVENNEISTNMDDLNVLQTKVYPNPTTGILQIEGLPQNEITVVSVFNVMGQKLAQKEINKQNSTIDLSLYKKGIYYLSFNNSFISAVKIIKE